MDLTNIFSAALLLIQTKLSVAPNGNRDAFMDPSSPYENDTFSVHAFDWHMNDQMPNFFWKGNDQCPGIQAFWFVDFLADCYWTRVDGKKIALENINEMLNDCIKSLEP